MSEGLFIGIDGGSTSCRARIRDAGGNLLGEGRSGPANIQADLPLAKKSVWAASKAAAQAAGLTEQSLHAGLGLAGAGLESACNQWGAEPGPFASTVVGTDAQIAWLGAHGGSDGAVVILGTGSCGLAIVNGRRTYVGGWGAEVSDEAGGHMMGRGAIRFTLWAFDGRVESTPLSTAILNRFGTDPARIVSFASTATPAAYAALAPLVFDCAAMQDPLALALIKDATNAAVHIINRLHDVGSPAISLAGGLAVPLAAWLPSPVRELLTSPQSDPLDGAILMARRAFSSARSNRIDEESSAATVG